MRPHTILANSKSVSIFFSIPIEGQRRNYAFRRWEIAFLSDSEDGERDAEILCDIGGRDGKDAQRIEREKIRVVWDLAPCSRRSGAAIAPRTKLLRGVDLQ